MLEKGDAVATGKVVSGLLRNMTVNLWGLGATVIGLQVQLLPRLTLTSLRRWPRRIHGGGPGHATTSTPTSMEVHVMTS